jgi:hypothetical protein
LVPRDGIAQVVKILHNTAAYLCDDVPSADTRLGGWAIRLDFPDDHAFLLVPSARGGVRTHSQIGLQVLLRPLLIAGLGLDGRANPRQANQGRRGHEMLVHADLLLGHEQESKG